MTKVIILGEPAEKKEGKKIEFVHRIRTEISGAGRTDVRHSPSEYEYVELVRSKSHSSFFDIFLAYDDDRSKGVLYLGHFNDGIV